MLSPIKLLGQLLLMMGVLPVVTSGCLSNVFPAGKVPIDQLEKVKPVVTTTFTNVPGWQLVFNDEFDGSQLDQKKWRSHYFWSRTAEWNNEEQFYADDAFEFQDGYIRLKAEKRRLQGYEYTSGMIASYDSFWLKYGRVEIRARVPKGRGLWPAFWLMSFGSPLEIDVLEVLGHTPDIVYMTNHYKNENGEVISNQGLYNGPDFSEEFHIFAVEWNAEQITWYVDGIERHKTRTGVPQEPLYILANLAVGGAWPGSPDESTPFPSYYDVDFIRVYQQTPLSPPASPIPELSWCYNQNGEKNYIVKAGVPAESIIKSQVYCCVVNVPGGTGPPDIPEFANIPAVEVFSVSMGNNSDIQFNTGIKVCIRDHGDLIFLDAIKYPFTVVRLPTTEEGDYICASIPGGGTVGLVRPGTQSPIANNAMAAPWPSAYPRWGGCPSP